MNKETYREFLASRILVKNDFGSLDALIRAIDDAGSTCEIDNWQLRKSKFNAIADAAPFRNSDAYGLLRYEDLRDFIEEECHEFANFISPVDAVLNTDNVSSIARAARTVTHNGSEITVHDAKAIVDLKSRLHEERLSQRLLSAKMDKEPTAELDAALMACNSCIEALQIEISIAEQGYLQSLEAIRTDIR